MAETRDDASTRGVLRTAMIIRAALIMGVLTFTAVVLFLNQSAAGTPDASQRRGDAPGRTVPRKIITYAASGYGVVTFLAVLVIPPFLDRGIRRRIHATQGTSGDAIEARLARGLLNKTVIDGALLEGAALLCLIAHLLEKMPITLILTGLLVLEMALSFPTRDRAMRWIEWQKAQMQPDRSA